MRNAGEHRLRGALPYRSSRPRAAGFRGTTPVDGELVACGPAPVEALLEEADHEMYARKRTRVRLEA